MACVDLHILWHSAASDSWSERKCKHGWWLLDSLRYGHDTAVAGLKCATWLIVFPAGASPLMVAAGKGREEEAMVLLANGADPRLRAKDGSSAGDWADRSA